MLTGCKRKHWTAITAFVHNLFRAFLQGMCVYKINISKTEKKIVGKGVNKRRFSQVKLC